MSTILNVQSFAKLPLCTDTPISDHQLITKVFADSTYATIAGEVTLAGTNAWTGTNSYNVSLPSSTVTPSADSDLITKIFADSTYQSAVNAATLDGDNAFTGLNSFDVSLPTSIVTPSGDTDLVTKVFADSTYAGIAADNEFSGQNIFDSNPKFPSGGVGNYIATCQGSDGTWGWAALPNQPIVIQSQTSNATPQSILDIGLPSGNAVINFNGFVNAASASYADCTGGTFSATIKVVGGTGTLVSTAFVTVNATSTATFNIVVSGSYVSIIATGLAATTYNWQVEYNMLTA